MDRSSQGSAKASDPAPALGSGTLDGHPAAGSSISYNRDSRTTNQTPSTPLALHSGTTVSSSSHPPLDPQLDIPDVPPPSYEEATGISATVPAPSSASARPAAAVGLPSGRVSGRPAPPAPTLPNRPVSQSSPAMPGAYPQASASRPSYRPNAAMSGVYGQAKGGRRPVSTAAAGSSSGSGGGRVPAPGSVARGRQFPAIFNLYGDNWSRNYMLGEHQQTPLYAVRMRPTWQMTNPIVALHNGVNPETTPLLAAVDYLPQSGHMSVTLPPPLTYTGTGSTAVRLEMVMGWSHFYAFTMEVGTDPSNVHMETFEWRHSYGNAVAALGGTRDGWKLVRMSTIALPGVPRPRPPPGFVSSDGHEVVAIYSDARMSMTKQLKFAFVGTGLTGALGERWAVMAATSALGIWEKEEAVQSRR